MSPVGGSLDQSLEEPHCAPGWRPGKDREQDRRSRAPKVRQDRDVRAMLHDRLALKPRPRPSGNVSVDMHASQSHTSPG